LEIVSRRVWVLRGSDQPFNPKKLNGFFVAIRVTVQAFADLEKNLAQAPWPLSLMGRDQGLAAS
jgi:hypothetical protein